jgi:hypothetical protein
MKRKGGQVFSKCYQLGSFLLIVLFLSISVVQAFHNHDQIVNTEQSDDNDYVSASNKCQLCAYSTHKQGKEFYLNYPLIQLLPALKPERLNTNVFVGNYKFTLQGFTNKGPPAVIC